MLYNHHSGVGVVTAPSKCSTTSNVLGLMRNTTMKSAGKYYGITYVALGDGHHVTCFRGTEE